jgi:hypothetical protein
MAIVATVGLCALARQMPARWWTGQAAPTGRPLWFGLLGFASTLLFFLLHWIFPEYGVPVPLTMLSAVALVWLVFIAVSYMSGEGAWSDVEKLALVSGALTFFILLAPLSEFDASRPDNPAGMTLVGLATFFFLLWLRRATRRRLQDGTTP